MSYVTSNGQPQQDSLRVSVVVSYCMYASIINACAIFSSSIMRCGAEQRSVV